MAAPVYSTDLVLMTNAESGTWTEFSAFSGGGTPALDGENFIQGSDCYSQTLGNKSGALFSIAYDAGSDQSGNFSAGDCVFIWMYFAVPEALQTYASLGWRFGIAGSTTSNLDYWVVGGSDYKRNPFGGWTCEAVDPTSTPTSQLNGGNSGVYRYFGSIPVTTAVISKGTPHAVDAIRRGRGEIKAVNGDGTNGYATFTQMGEYNNLNTASAYTYSNDSDGYNRFGLFQEQFGVYYWKGLISLGDSTTSVDFRDSDKNISIEQCLHTYASFNKIEINNSSSNVEWTRINFTTVNESDTAPGQFEMVDNATVAMDGCNFVGMDTFIFQSNATVGGCTFIRCGQITHGGADFDSCKFIGYEGTADTGYLTYNVNADPDGEMDNCYFEKGTAATHAISFGTSIPSSITLRGIDFSGYNASNGQNDSTLYFADTAGTITVNLIGCSGNITYKTAGATISLVTNPVTFTVTVRDINTRAAIQNAKVTVWADTTGPLPYNDSVTIVQSAGTATVTHTAHGLATNQWVEISGANESAYNGLKQITKINDNSYSYTVPSGTSSPATGTITATAVIINGETDASGQISDTRSYSSDQDYTGKALKGTHSPVYKEGPLSGTIDSGSGGSANVLMIPD